MTSQPHEIPSPVAPSQVALEVRVTGRRIMATVADVVLLGVVLSGVVDGAAGLAQAVAGGSEAVGGLGALLVTLGIPFAYYTVLEGHWGRTVGKGLFGIRVVREGNGEAPGKRAAALRTLLRIVDGFLFYLVGLVTILASRKRQRLGDMVSGTLVVREKRTGPVAGSGGSALAGGYAGDDYYDAGDPVEADCDSGSSGWDFGGGGDCDSGGSGD